MFDQIFDLLNSWNPLGKGSKAPMSRANAEKWAQTINDAESYIVGLKDIKRVGWQARRSNAIPAHVQTQPRPHRALLLGCACARRVQQQPHVDAVSGCIQAPSHAAQHQGHGKLHHERRHTHTRHPAGQLFGE